MYGCWHISTPGYASSPGILVAVSLNQQHGCFGYNQFGHFCAKRPWKGSKSQQLCLRFKKGNHWVRDCWSKYNINDQPLLPVGNYWRSTMAGSHNDSKFPSGGCRSLYARSHSSIGVDLATSSDTILNDTTVTLPPTGIYGTLGNGMAALLIGQSSATRYRLSMTCYTTELC